MVTDRLAALLAVLRRPPAGRDAHAARRGSDR